MTEVLLARISEPEAWRIERYRELGGYEALTKALKSMTPEEVAEEVKTSEIRGRGGAGFPMGVKWGFLPEIYPRYLVINADEGEPGTFKDRELIEFDPHQLIEGTIIAAYALKVNWSSVYIRGEMVLGAARLENAVRDAYEAGYLGKNILGTGFDLDIVIHRGAGAYICGEETALLSSLEGQRGEPRLKPPFPAVEGLYAKPTIVNNVETISAVPHIVNKGGAWYASLGTEKSRGTKIFSLSGHVNRPGNYEVELGTTFRTLIDEYGLGVRGGNKLKAVIPGGASSVWFVEEDLDTPLDFDAIAAAGSMLGSGAVIVMDETTCAVRAAARLVKFFSHESCGQCTPCREGCAWMYRILTRIEEGAGRPEDLELLLSVGSGITPALKSDGRMTMSEVLPYTTICVLGPSAVTAMAAPLRLFREEFEEHIRLGACPTASGATAGGHRASDSRYRSEGGEHV